MKKCIRCGAELDDNVKFCSECGAQMPQVQQPEQPEQQAGSADNNATYVNDSRTGKENPNFQQSAAPQNTDAPGKGQALASLICGIASVVTSIPLCVIGVILGVVAVILGITAKKKLPPNQTQMATAGFITGLVGAAIGAVILIILATIIFNIASHMPSLFSVMGHM